MKHRKNILLYLFTISIILSIIPNPDSSVAAFATPQNQGTLLGSIRGSNYNDTAFSNGTHVWSTQPQWMNNGIGYVPYVLNQTSNNVIVTTQQGSYNFNKNTCSLSFYGSNSTTGTPTIGSDTYSVRAELNGTSNWLNVNTVNNAACTTSINQTGNNIEIIGTKSSPGNGVFKIHYLKKDGQYLKTTLEATNNNAAWTNYHLGLSQSFQVPNLVTLGNQTYDLSLYNNTVLDRNWINNHKAQLIQLTSKVYFDFTPAFSHINDITILYKNNQATLIFDYLYNTPILSPGNTISIDPTYGYTNAANTYGWYSNIAGSANTSCTNLGTYSNGGGSTMELFAQTSGSATAPSCGSGSGRWTDINTIPSTSVVDSATIKYTMSVASNAQSCNYYALIHDPASATTTQGYTESTSGTSFGTDSSCSSGGSGKTFSLNSNGISDITSAISTSRSWWGIGISNTAQPSTRDGSVHDQTTSALQLQVVYHAAPKVPTAPTLNAVNQISSTSLNVTWSSSVGANWYQENRSSPAGGSLINVVNTTALFHLDTGLTPGTQYQYGIQAGNASGHSAVSNKISRYTVNVAPTLLTTSLITSSKIRVGWTNPSGNFSGFKVEKANGTCSSWTVAVSNTNNSTNRYDVTGMASNVKQCFRVSTNYATGSSDAGISSPSSTTSAYTLPASPTGLTVTQNQPNLAHLAWTDGGGNGTATGYFIEISTNNGGSWRTVIANTGNTTTAFNQTGVAAGKTFWRVSEIKSTGGGTSAPSSTANIIVWQLFTVRAFLPGNVTANYGSTYQSNSTSSNNVFTLFSGVSKINGTYNNQNMSVKNGLVNMFVKKQYNVNTTSTSDLNLITNDFLVDCPFTGVGNDVEIWVNETDGHRISSFPSPTCYSNDTVKLFPRFTANGQSGSSFTTVMWVKVINATFLNNATLKSNTTSVTTVLSSPYIISNSITVGTGLQTRTLALSMNLTIAPGFIPVNFTVGHISVSGVNPVTVPIKFSSSIVNSSATAVTVTFPSTYTMGYNVTFGNEGVVKTYTGLPVTSPSLGVGQSIITFKNPGNDFVTIKGYDLTSKTSGSFILAQPNTNVPFVTQFQNFKNGLFGTSAMIGGINIIDLIVLIVAMIGLNRANEIVGAFMMVIIVGVAGFFQIITWPTAMVSGIALAVLVTVVTMKKYQNS
jgi:hypothetical protein